MYKHQSTCRRSLADLADRFSGHCGDSSRRQPRLSRLPRKGCSPSEEEQSYSLGIGRMLYTIVSGWIVVLGTDGFEVKWRLRVVS